VILFFQSKSLTHSVRTLRCPNLITRFDSIFNQKFDYNYGTQGFIIHPHVFEVNLHPIDFALHYYDLRGTEVTFQNNTNTIAYSRSFSLSIFLISFIFTNWNFFKLKSCTQKHCYLQIDWIINLINKCSSSAFFVKEFL